MGSLISSTRGGPSPSTIELDQEMIRSSLRKRGFYVRESDLKDALARHSPVEAITFLIESGRARRGADVQRSSTIRLQNGRRNPSAATRSTKRAIEEEKTHISAGAIPKRRKLSEEGIILDRFLDVRAFQHAMLSGVKYWFGKTPEDKNETVRSVKSTLCLLGVGPKRKGRLDDQLSRRLEVALTDLGDAPDVKAGAILICDIVKSARSNIHDVVAETGKCYADLFERPEETASRGRGRRRKAASSSEASYWIASDICQEAFQKFEITQNEEEWLAHEADVVRKAADGIVAILRRESQRHKEKVEKVEGDVQRLSGEVEELTRGLVDEHVASSHSKEEALLSFLDSLDGEDGAGDRKVRKRARAIALLEAARLSCRKANAERLLVSHAVEIGEVLCHELFGDLLDILSDMELRVTQRRQNCQSYIKKTVKFKLDKLEAAIGSLKHERHVAAKKRARESRRLYGNVTTNAAADQDIINEMEFFMEESTRKIEAMKVDAEATWRRLEGVL